MPILQIDGVGRVEVGKDFLSLPPDRQAAEVESIAAMLKPQAPAVPSADGGSPPAAAVAQAGADTGPVGRVMSRAGEVAAARFGDQPFGLSETTIKELRDRGALAQEGTAATPIQLLNEVVYRFGAKAGDAILRAIGAGIGAVGGAAEQAAVELGEDPGMARRLSRDIQALPEAMAGIVPTARTGVPARTAAPAAERAAVPAAAREGAAVEARALPTEAPGTAAGLKTASQSYYKAAEDAGVVIKPESYRVLSDDIFKTAARNGLDPTLTPDSVAAIKRIQELADPRVGPVSFQTLDLMRQIANDAKSAVKPADRRVASLVVDKMDDYIDKLGTKDIVAGDARLASETIVVARDLWHRASKLDTVTDIIERAKNNVSKTVTFEHALRTQFRQLANNKAKLRTFTPDEQKAIKLAARGTVAMKAARGASKMAPRGVVSATLGGGAGAAVASAIGLPPMLGSAAAFAIGETGAQVANALAKRGVRQLEELIAQGGRSEMAVASIQRANRMLGSLQGGTAAASTAGALEPQRRRK